LETDLQHIPLQEEAMTTPQIIGLIVLAAITVIAAAWYASRRKRTMHLREHFGTEYDRRVAEAGSRDKAEAELAESEARVRSVRRRPLSETERAEFLQDWKVSQALFVDDPAGALVDADRLLSDIMRARGYDVGDAMNRTTDICAAYPRNAMGFREASDIVIRQRRGNASTEELRKAFLNFRNLFEEILGGPNERIQRAS
jgi:hypothetical protein